MITDNDIFNANILIVDDLQDSVQLLESMLQEFGYLHITSTTDPHAVCMLHDKNQYDLILLDLEMPEMSGIQVMQALKDMNPQSRVQILVITAHQALNVYSLNAGAKDFISKPFDFREAKTRIHNLLESHLRLKQLKNYCVEQETLAMHDPLTGLPNRRLLEDRINLAIAHAHRNNFAMGVIYLDLDGFKQINDTFGHDAGDALLKMVAIRLTQAVRKEDTVSRLSGDEFVIVLLDINHDNDVSSLMSKLIETIAEPYLIKKRKIRITASIGAAIYPINGEDVATLINSADSAMYAAKNVGKNAYRIATGKDMRVATGK